MPLLVGRTRYLSVPEAAKRIGVARMTLYRWLRGTRTPPVKIAAKAVARELHTGRVYVLERTVDGLRAAARVTRARGARPRRR